MFEGIYRKKKDDMVDLLQTHNMLGGLSPAGTFFFKPHETI